MSRCFPYPPPGFIGKKASDSLIDSIKLQKENEANKEKRKEKRREKREKKEKKGEKNLKKEIVDFKLTEVREAHKDGKNVLSQKRKREDTEQLEGSSVTEEHGQPLNSQNPSYSSDGTQNSNKRIKQASVAIDSRGHGNIIRIKLPLQKHKESESTVPVNKEQLDSTSVRNVQNKESDVNARKEQCCSTSGRNEMHKEQLCSVSGWTDRFDYPEQDAKRTSQGDVSLTSFMTNNTLQGLSSGPGNGLGCSAFGNTDNFAQGNRQTTSGSVPGSSSTSRDKKMQKNISKYNDLIQNLYQMAVPSPSESVDNDGEEWLFGGKPSNTGGVIKGDVKKQFPINSGVTCSSSSTLYPRARYLEEAEIFALPYTVPF